MLHVIKAHNRTRNTIRTLLKDNPQVQFLSLVAVDLGNNHTDERIPIQGFLDNMEDFLKEGVQTDGSSVVLPIIAEINNAKVDLIPDQEVHWLVDYNYDHIHQESQRPIGTLMIPATLKHRGVACDSRSILKAASRHFQDSIMALLKNNPHFCQEMGVTYEAIEEVELTAATELEFWVKSPDSRAEESLLSVSQILKEQYWKRTVGSVRSAMEASLLLLDAYGFEAEMAHKEVGGVPSKLQGSNKFSHVMEQLEIDWKYACPIQTADHELFARDIISDCFARHGLEVTFKAKPIEGVAGSGEHHHVGAALRLKDKTRVNLFSPQAMDQHFLNRAGYGALMGLLRNYDLINPFVSATNDAFNRLKPGFEAPVCAVTSLGHSPQDPSRNRTVLVGLVRDIKQPLTSRFELRSPNPLTNTYLCTAAIYQAMCHGIVAVIEDNKSLDFLEENFDRPYGQDKYYLEKNRAYRSEEDVFHCFTQDQRDAYFGKAPQTVWENIQGLEAADFKTEVLMKGQVFSPLILASYVAGIQSHWTFELENRILLENMDLVGSMKKIDSTTSSDLDLVRWEAIQALRLSLIKDSISHKSLFSDLKKAILENRLHDVSRLQCHMQGQIKRLKDMYLTYKANIID